MSIQLCQVQFAYRHSLGIRIIGFSNSSRQYFLLLENPLFVCNLVKCQILLINDAFPQIRCQLIGPVDKVVLDALSSEIGLAKILEHGLLIAFQLVDPLLDGECELAILSA